MAITLSNWLRVFITMQIILQSLSGGLGAKQGSTLSDKFSCARIPI